jgi:hypothetical protein
MPCRQPLPRRRRRQKENLEILCLEFRRRYFLALKLLFRLTALH